MRTAHLLVFAAALFASVLLGSVAMAQGCGARPLPSTIDCCGNPNHPYSDCSGSGGDPNNFCFTSFGNCCGVGYSLANVAPSTKCSPLSKVLGPGPASYRPGVLPAGSCSNHGLQIADALISSESYASRQPFVLRERLNFEATR